MTLPGVVSELIGGDLTPGMVLKKGAALSRLYQDRRRATDSFQYLLGKTGPLKIYPGHGGGMEDGKNAPDGAPGFRIPLGKGAGGGPDSF